MQHQKADIVLLQETYWDKEIVENEIRKEWKGHMHNSYGSNHSKGVSILISENIDCKVSNVKSDDEGRKFIIENIFSKILF